ncbi:hypothetical protein GOARA_056_02150 [Gordonia araii NBRC 100433]|uniref:Uncharacterized protein n=1 Tax=Gordonia araii NBRC 100433 TaxID=1073574 RepID=G7H3P2_9ACTN|nr:hypothetical protein GOARA_056_02150 [Gordonia araii NBRC 100433]
MHLTGKRVDQPGARLNARIRRRPRRRHEDDRNSRIRRRPLLRRHGAAHADRDDGPEFPDTRDAGTYHSQSACREAGDRAVSNRQARSYNCTLAPGANYKLRINPQF